MPTTMNALLARCSRPVPTSWAAGYALPLRLIVGYGFMEHGYAKLARGPDSFTAISVDCCQATSAFVLAAPHSIFNVQRHKNAPGLSGGGDAFRAAAMNVWREAVAV